MKLRKANAVLSLITTIMIFGHAISLAAWMLSRGSIQKAPSFMAWALTAVTVIHAIMSILIMRAARKDEKKNESKQYSKMNASTKVQRVSGILMILFTWLHIAGTVGIMEPPPVIHAIVPPLFFLLVMIHVAISVSKAFITLGIGTAKFVKRVDIAVKVICVVTLIADVIGFYLHVC